MKNISKQLARSRAVPILNTLYGKQVTGVNKFIGYAILSSVNVANHANIIKYDNQLSRIHVSNLGIQWFPFHSHKLKK